MHVWDVPAIYYVAMITLIKCELWLLQGQLELAPAWLARLAETYGGEQGAAAPEFHPQLPLHIELQQAVLERQQGLLVPAELRLRALLSRAEAAGANLLGTIVQVHLLQVLLALGRESQALAMLGRCLDGAVGGALMPFRELLEQRPQWLREQLLARPESAQREALLQLLPVASVIDAPEPASLNEALSSRELAVLQLIAQGCSNQEISERLFISLNTVKTHARHINSKLDVERRTQAVARAKALGLLS